MTPQERHAYDEHLSALMIQNDVLQEIDWDQITNKENIGEVSLKSCEGFDPGNKYCVPYTLEGRAEGRAEGREEGRAEGREEGREEGIKEGVLRNARRMKEKGFSTEDIMEITGLTFEEVSQL